MIRFVVSALALFFIVSPASAAEPDAAAITKAIEGVANDPVKAKAYCDMADKFDDIGDDDKKAEAASSEIDGYFKTLGPDFEAAWDAGQNAEENSAEGKAFDEAMTKLDATCGGDDKAGDTTGDQPDAPADDQNDAPADDQQ